MEILTQLLGWAKAHPTETAALAGFLLEIASRKFPGSITFLHGLSKALDKIPGLKNNEG